MANISLSKQKNNRKKNNHVFDDSLITLITTIINEKLKFSSTYRNIHKGVWLWNFIGKCYACSPDFYSLMNISPQVIPDLDFWINQLAPDDLIKFTDTLDGIFHDSQPRNFIFQITVLDGKRKTIQCFIESFKDTIEDMYYVIGVFYDVSDSIFANDRN